ncbi:PREDICTED: clarin-1 isoform X1 [Dipodomys ordii]|uniref:Clarin-1 isoform X1 n=1 Tax=Dipodomys ordii TaxID=10020 RepID=A0A1S3GAS2_DIPOR|nr:PREDICTED: clarin-1 isoform X1 [Dipodomys ordii]
MPNQQKKILFCVAGVLSFACALGVVAALGTPRWMRATFLCTTGALLVNASGPELDKFTGEVHYGLFHGEGVRQCGLGARPFRFSFFPDLLPAVPVSVHINVLLFATMLAVLTMVVAGFFMYNAVGKPFETLHGPLGLYLLSFISGKDRVPPPACMLPRPRDSAQGSCGCLVMILFASEVKIHHLSEKIANFKEGTFAYRTQSERYTTSFWVVFMCFFVHFLNGLLIRLAGFQFPFAKSKDAETTNVAADLMY